MKKIFCILLSVLFVQSIQAQMDEKFYHPDKEWLDINFLNYHEIILNADNDTIYSVIITPDTFPKASILYFHGNSGNISKCINFIRPLVNDGYQVCTLEYRGYGKSSRKPTHLNIANDAQSLLDTLLKREDIALLTTPTEYHEQVKQFVISPYSAKDDIREIKNIKTLFIHSNEDVIPIEGAKEVYSNSPCTKMFWIYEGKHIEASIKYPETFVEYINKLL